MTSEAYDFVVIGAGSAGCVLASRLTEDPDTTVCLVEAGANDTHPMIHMPVGFAAMVLSKTHNWAFETTPQAGLNGRRGYQPRGKVLGGSSSINAMLYVRGHASDYDSWEQAGNHGWGYRHVLPYFRKSEHNENFQDDFHGTEGPLNVRSPDRILRVSQLFLDSAGACGVPMAADYNGRDQDGAHIYQVTQKGGERCSAAKAFVTPNLSRPNLRVLTRAHGQRIIIENGTAVGAIIRIDGEVRELRARREVILAAGAFGSPQLLMLSGVGPARHLAEFNIPVVKDSPGVGENLQDHLDNVYQYKSTYASESFGFSMRGMLRSALAMRQWQKTRTGLMTSVICETGAFIRSGPEQTIPDLQLVFIGALEDDHGRRRHSALGFAGRIALLRPKSRGTVRLASPDALAAPLIDPNYLSQPEDLAKLIYGTRRMIEIMQAPPLAPVRRAPLYPLDIADDHAVEQHVRNNADTQYHPVGSCRMGSDERAVVDDQLRVRGIARLRVIDASIMPTIPGGNTNAPTIMIAEKGADLLRERAA